MFRALTPGDEQFARLLRWALLCLLVWLPLPFGSVLPAGVVALQVPAFLLGALAAIHWARSDRPPRLLGAAIPAAVILTIGLLQLVPLPADLLALGNPQEAELRERVAAAIGSETTLRAQSVHPAATVDALLRFGAYLALGLTAAVTVRQARHALPLALVAAAVGTFEGLYGAIEYLSGNQQIFDYAKRHFTDSASGTFINRNHFAGFLALALPWALALIAHGFGNASGWREALERWNERRGLIGVVGAIALVSIWLGIALSYSRTGLVVALFALVWFTVRVARLGSARYLLVFLLLVPTILLLRVEIEAPGERFLAPESELATLNGRLPMWRAAVEAIPGHAVAGAGFGTFEDLFVRHRPEGFHSRLDHAHNDWLQVAVEGGLIALVAAIWLFLGVFRRLPGGRTEALFFVAAQTGVAAIALHSLLDFCLRIPAIAAWTAVLFGAIQGLATATGDTARN